MLRSVAVASVPSSSTSTSSSHRRKRILSSSSAVRYVVGLTIGGVGSSLLTTAFGVFHVETFLTAYQLPLSSFASGSALYALFNTANDLCGAWVVDMLAARYGGDRSSAVGISGAAFALCFLTPFFRWGPRSSSSLMDTAHFVISLSLYDTMFSFTAILMGSIVNDDDDLTESGRIRILTIGKCATMLASFGVAKIGLAVFDTQNLYMFRVFVVALAFLVILMYAVSHALLKSVGRGKSISVANKRQDEDCGNDGVRKQLKIRRVVRDFVRHPNFRRWIVMEMLLEGQYHFAASFQKTFVDHLLHGAGSMSREGCNLLLSSVRPLAQVCGFLIYVPIRKIGYAAVYRLGFFLNFTLGLFVLMFGSPSSKLLVSAFLSLNLVILSSIQSGYHLAMSDMILEMKLMQAREGRRDEPSLAGLFMGANALACKPMDSFLPIVAARCLASVGFNERYGGGRVVDRKAASVELSSVRGSSPSEWVLFYLLVGPSVVFSVVQLCTWRGYNLNEGRVVQMRSELSRMRSQEKLTTVQGCNEDGSIFQTVKHDIDDVNARVVEV